jgi:hypothetical protein
VAGRLRLIALVEEAAPPLFTEAGEVQADEYESRPLSGGSWPSICRRCIPPASGRRRRLDTAAAGAIIGALRGAPVGSANPRRVGRLGSENGLMVPPDLADASSHL